MPIKSVQKKAEPPQGLIDPSHELPAPETKKSEPPENNHQKKSDTAALISLTLIVLLILILALLSLVLNKN